MLSELIQQASWQHGLLTLAQIERAGHRHLIRRRVATGEWVERQPCVVGPAGRELSFEAELTAVRLSIAARGPADGWCFSHTTAAHLLKLKVPDPPDLHALLPISRSKLDLNGVHVHFTRAEPSIGHVQLNPVAAPTLAILQSATVLDRGDLLHLVEGVLRDKRSTTWALRQQCRRGVSGASALRGVLDEIDQEGLDKWMRVLVRLLVAAGLPRPRLEVPIHDGPRVYAVLDGYCEEAELGVEVDDWASHGPRAAAEHDNQRDRWLLKNRGIVTLRFTPREIRTQPERVVADVAEAYRQRFRRAG